MGQPQEVPKDSPLTDEYRSSTGFDGAQSAGYDARTWTDFFADRQAASAGGTAGLSSLTIGDFNQTTGSTTIEQRSFNEAVQKNFAALDAVDGQTDQRIQASTIKALVDATAKLDGKAGLSGTDVSELLRADAGNDQVLQLAQNIQHDALEATTRNLQEKLSPKMNELLDNMQSPEAKALAAQFAATLTSPPITEQGMNNLLQTVQDLAPNLDAAGTNELSEFSQAAFDTTMRVTDNTLLLDISRTQTVNFPFRDDRSLPTDHAYELGLKVNTDAALTLQHLNEFAEKKEPSPYPLNRVDQLFKPEPAPPQYQGLQTDSSMLKENKAAEAKAGYMPGDGSGGSGSSSTADSAADVKSPGEADVAEEPVDPEMKARIDSLVAHVAPELQDDFAKLEDGPVKLVAAQLAEMLSSGHTVFQQDIDSFQQTVRELVGNFSQSQKDELAKFTAESMGFESSVGPESLSIKLSDLNGGLPNWANFPFANDKKAYEHGVNKSFITLPITLDGFSRAVLGRLHNLDEAR